MVHEQIRALNTSHNTLLQEASRPALTMWSEEESMLRDSVARFANETIKPRVRAMDESSTLDHEVLKGCFDQGECRTLGRDIYMHSVSVSVNGVTLTNHCRSDGH